MDRWNIVTTLNYLPARSRRRSCSPSPASMTSRTARRPSRR
jgi:hypothetical protein